TSVFKSDKEGITHSRLLDFPLTGIFDENPRLYLWQSEGHPTIMSYSCEGLAPLFFQAIHDSGVSFALHHKPGMGYHKDGQSIFEIVFETLFTLKEAADFRRELRQRTSVTKWGCLLLDQQGHVQVMDIDGPTLTHESFDLKESGTLIFTNLPLQRDLTGMEAYLRFSTDRQ